MQPLKRVRLSGKRLAMIVMPAMLFLMGGFLIEGVSPSLALIVILLLGSGVLGIVVWQHYFSRRVISAHELTRLQAGDARFRAMLESLPNIAVQGYDRQRRVIFWNEESANLYGYSEEQAKGRLLEDLIIPETMRSQVIRQHQAWVMEGKPIPAGQLVLRHQSGAEVPVFSYHAMLGEGSDAPVMFCVDVPLDRTPE